MPRILASIVSVFLGIGIAVPIAIIIPFLLALILPATWGVYAMYWLVFFTGAGTVMLGMQVFKRYRLLGTWTFAAAVVIGGFALTLVALPRVRDSLLPQIVDVDVTAITATEETLIRPLPYSVKAEDVSYTSETFHRQRTSTHNCFYNYAMPVCSVALGCREDLWVAERIMFPLRATENCSDLSEPNWTEEAQAPWLRVAPSTSAYEELVGGTGLFLTPAEEPSVSPIAVFLHLRQAMGYIAMAVAVLLVIEISYGLWTEHKTGKYYLDTNT